MLLSRLGQRVASTTPISHSQRASFASSRRREQVGVKSSHSTRSDFRPLSTSSLSVPRWQRTNAVGFLSTRSQPFPIIPARTMSSLLTNVELCSDLQTSDYDSIVVVTESVDSLPFDELKNPLKAVVDLDAKAEKGVFFIPSGLPSKRLIFSGTGPMDGDYDDVRSYANAAEKGIKKAIGAGSRAPLLFFAVNNKFSHAGTVSVLGALKALYVPIETREAKPEKAAKVDKIGVFGAEDKVGEKINLVKALEAGRIVSRDIGGSDPERMAAPRVEEYVRNIFENTGVKIEVVKGQSTFEKEYPSFAAVNRCASEIPRHDGRVIWLTWEPEGPVEQTLMLVGKGVTYDTGGLDIKHGGIMAGMSRDKCGAADVAGIVKAISILKPKGIKVVAAMAMVRNSCGNNGYVSDEIITSRFGVRMRIGNTDAEGRMAMVDVLCHMKEKALKETNPHLYTIATLTGHAARTYGPYTAVMDNGPAAKERTAYNIMDIGDSYGDMFEVSKLRTEDFENNKDKCGDFVEVLQLNTAPSASSRGHMLPAAFMMLVSGLDKHMLKDSQPLKYTHLDVAGSSGKLPEPTTAASVIGLVMNALSGK